MATETKPASRNGLAIASLVLGILGLIVEFIFLGKVFGALIGVAAIILGIMALGQIKRTHSAGKGAAITGIVLGCLPVVIFLVLTLLGGIIGNMVGELNG